MSSSVGEATCCRSSTGQDRSLLSGELLHHWVLERRCGQLARGRHLSEQYVTKEEQEVSRLAIP